MLPKSRVETWTRVPPRLGVPVIDLAAMPGAWCDAAAHGCVILS